MTTATWTTADSVGCLQSRVLSGHYGLPVTSGTTLAIFPERFQPDGDRVRSGRE